MKAIILAAGYCTRLYPITLDKPKALLSIGKKRTLDLIVEKIPRGIDKKYIVTNGKFYPLFEEWREKNPKINANLINDLTSCNENRLGAIRDMYLGVSKSKKDDALIIASDNIFDFELNDAFELFKKKNSDVIVAYDITDKSKASRFGVLSIDKNCKILKFEEKPQNPETSLISTGLYFFKQDSLELMLEYIKENKIADGPGNFIQWLSKKKDVYASIAKGKWYDIGTLETYKEAVEAFTKK